MPGRSVNAGRLAQLDELDVEGEGSVRGDDAAGAAGTVAEIGRDDQGALAADAHPLHPLVPAADDHPRAEGELEGLVAVAAAVELLAVVQPAGVVHHGVVAGLRLRTGSHLVVAVPQPRGRRLRPFLV